MTQLRNRSAFSFSGSEDEGIEAGLCEEERLLTFAKGISTNDTLFILVQRAKCGADIAETQGRADIFPQNSGFSLSIILIANDSYVGILLGFLEPLPSG